MTRKILSLGMLMILLIPLFASFAYASSASGSDKISIDEVRVNRHTLAEGKTNLIPEAFIFNTYVDLAAFADLQNLKVDAVLTDLKTGLTVSDSTVPFTLFDGHKTSALLLLDVSDLGDERFKLEIKVGNDQGKLESKIYFIAFDDVKGDGFDVSIDRVILNGVVLASSKENLVDDADVYSALVEFTALEDLEDAHVEAILQGKSSGKVVSDATATFDLGNDKKSSATLTLRLIDDLKREGSFSLTIKIIDAEGNVEQKAYGLATDSSAARTGLDVSIDRVKVNSKVVAESKTNFIDEDNEFDVLVEFTTLEDLEDAHVEAVLKDLKSGAVIADASPNFDMDEDTSDSRLLTLELINKLKQSNSFELTIKIVDAEGTSIKQIYGLTMNGRNLVSGAAGRALDVSVDSVEVESKILAADENNFLVIGEGEKEIGLRVRLTALENVENAHIDAVLAFENGDVVADATTTFDMGKDESTLKKLELPLIGPFEQNSFKLRVKVVDAEGDFEEKVYGLKISQKEFPFVISSLMLMPEDNVAAGKSLVVSLRFKNSGVVPLEGIRAEVSIPELGVSATRFADQLANKGKKSEIEEDFVLKIPDDAQTGTYTLRSEIMSQFGSESETKEMPILVTGTDDQTKQVVNDKLLINVPILKQDMRNDGSEVIYTLMLTNQGPDANAYTVLLDGADWASLRLSDSNTFVIRPKETKAINIFASTTAKVKGEQIFLVTIKSNDKVLKDIALKGNVASSAFLNASLKNILEITLIGIAVLLAGIGLAFGIKKWLEPSEEFSEEIPDQTEGEAYY